MRNFLHWGSSDSGGAASFIGGRLILQYKWQVASFMRCIQVFYMWHSCASCRV